MVVKSSFLYGIIFILVALFNQSITDPIVLFSHGIADTHKQAFWYAPSYLKNNITYYNDRYLFSGPFATFNYPDATEGILRVNYNETSFGQENEMHRLNSAYQKTIKWAQKRNTDPHIILFGISRGASNIAIFAGLHVIDKVKAIVLESPYYAMEDVIQNIMKKNNLEWVSPSYGQSIVEFIFKRYSRYGISPGDVIENIPKEMPILIVCSQQDQLVPFSSSVKIYKKLIESGHTNTYILILEHGRHAKILSGLDGTKYQEVVHAFYKKYNLPHSPSIAAKGEISLMQCQPIF